MKSTARLATICSTLVSVALLHVPAGAAGAQVGRGLTRAIERRAASSVASRKLAAVMRRDAARDAKAAIRALPRKLTTHRYVGGANLLSELKGGLRAGRHTTSLARPGRPPSSMTAQRDLGLPRLPDWRLKIVWPKGWPVRKTKALGGAPGRGEITSPLALPPSAVKGAVRLSRPRPRLPQ